MPYQVFEVADGQVILAVGNDAQFARFCAAAGVASMAAEPRFARNADRVCHRSSLVARLSTVMRERSRADWLATLEAAQVPGGPINSLEQVFAGPQVKAREMIETLSHPLDDALRLVASPLKLSATPTRTRHPPPLLGQHCREVLVD